MKRLGGDPNRVAERNAAWAEALIAGLADAGVRRFVISPGSRSTPLTLAAARCPIVDIVMHFDERGAGFHALGMAKAGRAPVGLVCTSGTAAANCLPAVAEAAYAAVPLIILTADRPPELIDVGANQTIRQTGIYGAHVRWTRDLPCPAPELPECAAYAIAQDAVRRAVAAPAGPVHLNVPFREPLIAHGRARNATGPRADAPTIRPPRRAPDPAAIDDLAERFAAAERPCIIAGGGLALEDAEAIAALSRAFACPLLADVLSGLRRTDLETIACYDLLLLDGAWTEGFRPDLTLRFGAPPLSKRLNRRLAELRDTVHAMVAEDSRRLDPDLTTTLRVDGDPASVCAGLIERLGKVSANAARSAWADRLIACERRARVLLAQRAEAASLDEPGAVRIALEAAAPGDAIFLGNSLPVRHADLSGVSVPPGATIYANRGASGIDGNVATAAGVARMVPGRVIAVIGDLALLHDLNSLALLRTPSSDGPPPRVTILTINNDGGGIFHLLPVHRETDVFERCFATPHGMDFAHAAAQFGLPYRHVGTPDALRDALAHSDPARVVELRTHRAALEQVMQAYRQAAHESAGGLD